MLVASAVLGGVLGAQWLVDRVREPSCVVQVQDRREEFTPEQTANAATVTHLAVQRGLPPRAASIALATAIQESKLRNIAYGHADSLGLFQQRPSQGWGTAEQVMDPVYAAGRFYDALVQVPGWQEGVITEVAQEVQRSAYPEAYADHERQGRLLASALSGETPAGLTCRLGGDAAGGSVQQTAEKAGWQTGLTPSIEADTLRFATSTSAQSWAIASWAVAHAEAEQVSRVQVAGRLWDREEDPLTWQDESGSGSAAGAQTVVVHIAP